MKSNADHIVVGMDSEGVSFRSIATFTWEDAQSYWNTLDDLRIAGRFPHVRWFAVRSQDDTQWYTAKPRTVPFLPVVAGSKGYTDSKGLGKRGQEKAARKALDLMVPSTTARQGNGGWFYFANGRPLTQGLFNLAKYMIQKGRIVQAGGRWFALDISGEAVR